MLRTGTIAGQHGDNILQRLSHLSDKISADETAVGVPPDLSGDRRLGDIARVAARTVTAAIRTLTGERALAVGIVVCLQTHGARADGHPHLHLLVTDGGFRPDGTFVAWPAPDTARLTEAFRRAVLLLGVRLELFDEAQAAGMLT